MDFTLIIKTFVLYFYIVFCYRLMGKKEIRRLSVIDLIVAVIIANLVAIGINGSILVSIVSIATLVVIQIILSYITSKSNTFKKIIDGSPRIIIDKGKINFNEMSKLRYSLDNLITQLREHKIKSIEEVKYAILENNGKLSVFTDDNIYPMPIIVDGEINIDTIKNMSKDIDWVYNILKKNKLDLEEVFYAFYTKEKTFIIKRENV